MNVPVRRLLWLVACALIPAVHAPALESSNLELVSRAAAQAVHEAVGDLDVAGHGENFQAVSVVPAAKHDANWLFEHLLVEELLNRGLWVTLDSTAADAARLSYRVVDLVVGGRSGLLSDTITRQCRVGLQLDFDLREERLWTGEGHAELSDRIPKGQLEALQHSRFSFARTELEQRSWGRYVEPVIVSAVLGSLVYVFFSNR